MLKEDWQDCRVNHPNNRKCQNSDCLSVSWTKLPLLLLHHHDHVLLPELLFFHFSSYPFLKGH